MKWSQNGQNSLNVLNRFYNTKCGHLHECINDLKADEGTGKV